jgi:hypothetical protein
MAVGDVRWCNKTSNTGIYNYGMGVKYCNPYV